MRTQRLWLGSLSFLFCVLHIAGCGSDEDCSEAKYEDTPISVVACQSGKLSVHSMPCFGMPDTCSYATTGAKLTLTVSKTTCRSSSDTSMESTGCSSSPVDFDCSGPTLPHKIYEIDSTSGKTVTLVVAADGSCLPH